MPASTDVPRDFAVNVVYHTIGDGLFDPAVDYQNHANEMSQLFNGSATGSGSTFKFYSHTQVTVKVYNMADAKPRPIRATSVAGSSTITAANHLPRVLAITLSYYATVNTPSKRGRIFIGPFNLTDEPSLGPSIGSSDQGKIVDLGHGLFDIGGENVAHVVYSEKLATSAVVTDYWCNDVWDVMHSREQKEASRTRLHP
jgi:hypothetical protein